MNNVMVLSEKSWRMYANIVFACEKMHKKKCKFFRISKLTKDHLPVKEWWNLQVFLLAIVIAAQKQTRGSFENAVQWHSAGTTF